MKTKELIRQLQEEDPTGEMDCCIGNADIHFVYSEVSYWDGCKQILIRDSSEKKYYNIIGGKYCSQGAKINLRPLSIEDAIFDNVDLPVFYDSDYTKKYYEKYVEECRERYRKINNKVSRDSFVEYMVKRLTVQYSDEFDEDIVRKSADQFFRDNMSHQDKMPEDIQYTPKISWHDRRCIQWDREIMAEFDNGDLRLSFTAIAEKGKNK